MKFCTVTRVRSSEKNSYPLASAFIASPLYSIEPDLETPLHPIIKGIIAAFAKCYIAILLKYSPCLNFQISKIFSHLGYCLVILSFAMNSGLCYEIGYAFTKEGYSEFHDADIRSYNLSDLITFTASGNDINGIPSSKNTVEELQYIFNERVEPENVIDNAANMIIASPGFHTIDQVFMIYNTLSFNWAIIGEDQGQDYFRYANESLKLGREQGLIGAGDCDDFAILMAALIESIGGTTRIILANGPIESHAYAEVYLGKMGSDEVNIERVKNWLIYKCNVEEINTHIDLENDNVWLNLDWQRGSRNATYPGYPFFMALKHIPIYINKDKPMLALNPSPIAIIKLSKMVMQVSLLRLMPMIAKESMI